MNKQTIIITGGSRGLGQVIVENFLNSEQFIVGTLSRKKNDFIDLMIEKYPNDFFYKEIDMKDDEKVKSFVEDFYKKYGSIDVLINNAGIALDGILLTQNDNDIRSMVEINLVSTIVMTKLCVRKMIINRAGKVINISSIVGRSGYRGLAVYSSTKAALDGFTRSLARELGSTNILVNSIAPGFLKTEMTAKLDEKQLKQIVRRTPLGRLGQPDDVLPLLKFLCSDGANFITGQTFVIDGGITI